MIITQISERDDDHTRLAKQAVKVLCKVALHKKLADLLAAEARSDDLLADLLDGYLEDQADDLHHQVAIFLDSLRGYCW